MSTILDGQLTLTDGELSEIELLLHQETELLDQCRYQEWLGLYTDGASYWVPAHPDQTDPENHVSLFFEDRALMQMRIKRLQHPQAHSLSAPLRTSHLTGRVVLNGPDEQGELTAKTRFQMTEYQRDEQRLFAGAYTYRLRRIDGCYRIAHKRVDLINCDSVFEPLQTFI